MHRNIDKWIKSYWLRKIKSFTERWRSTSYPHHILFTICDHYEPYWKNSNDECAYRRVQRWTECYPKIAKNHYDSIGGHPKHCFFYPIEEYKKNLIDMIGDICRLGFGETEVHLHHDNDNADNLRRTLLDYVNMLDSEHELVPRCNNTDKLKYGFIHGNWALDNSRPNGRWCGVNNEIEVLQETGCYADFTMPSAPDITQTRTINSIYYAVDDTERPKSHDVGVLGHAGVCNNEGLLCIQGPLGFNAQTRKYGIIPRIENGCLSADIPVTKARIKIWLQQHIHLSGRPDVIFIKLHTHGTQEKIMDYFFNQNGLDYLYTQLESICASPDYRLYYVSARQMYNVVKGLEIDPYASPVDLFDSELIL